MLDNRVLALCEQILGFRQDHSYAPDDWVLSAGKFESDLNAICSIADELLDEDIRQDGVLGASKHCHVRLFDVWNGKCIYCGDEPESVTQW